MVETGNHNHHHHHQTPPSQSAPPPAVAQPLGAARGPFFPPAEQLLQLHYCIHSNPSWVQTAILAFQHYIVMLGTTVMIASLLVPRMGGGPGDKARVIQSLLFMSGINTLLQTWFGTRLPTVMGPSFAYFISVLAIINDLNDSNFSNEHELVSAYFSRGFPQLGNCVEIGLPMLVLLVISQQYLQHIHPVTRPMLERFALLVCVGLIWAFAAILTAAGAYNHVKEQTKSSCRTDHSFLMSSAPWIKIPYPFQWGTPIFRASHVFGMMGAAFVSSAEAGGRLGRNVIRGLGWVRRDSKEKFIFQSTGTFYAAARLAGATSPPGHVLSRSIGLQASEGIGQLLEGIFGSVVGTTASVENVGLLGLTRVGSRRVVQISTAFMIFFSIFGKFGALFASIPLPIFAAIYCILYGIVAAIGISFIQFTNNNSMRNIYILGVSLFLGISIPQYFIMNTDMNGHGPVRTNGGWFNDILNTIFSSPPAVALIVGGILDNTLEARHAVDDRGLPWLVPFQRRKGDGRNEEFYSYPLRINEFESLLFNHFREYIGGTRSDSSSTSYNFSWEKEKEVSTVVISLNFNVYACFVQVYYRLEVRVELYN
ncbi:nucleobase-ascorbate transporter 3 [Phtheirospermum japonicum]|uniref:Nucleobase-ascorbate transporter 3 n=1 Tax=Phtheirospermum japonicum TaxID=374723 RepID=A0A830CEI5_9LAMI|nr:nucleobase-ascorbate transporter 3 [Phtheirospermum japonicum]